MEFVLNRLAFLGLNDKEIRVFTSLVTFGCMNMTKISSYSNLSRTTVDAIIRRLVKRELVFKKQVGKHYEYYVDLNDIVNKLNQIEENFLNKKNKNREIGEVRTCDVEGDLLNICNLHTGDRARLLLSYGDGDLEKNVARFVIYLKMIAKANMKVETMLCLATANAIRDNVNTFSSIKNLNSLILNIVPVSYCNALTDVFLFRDKILLTNVDKNEIHFYDDENIVELNKHLMSVASEVGWSVSLGSWLNIA